MGLVLNAPLPPTLAEAFSQLMEVNAQLLEEQRRTNELLANRKEKSDWMTGDEVAIALGKRPNKSGHHKFLQWCRDHGHLTIFGQCKPFTYSRQEVETLAVRVKAGDVYLL
ncbi:hypothetical protein [Neolewinella agarilytica]|uniref:Uncharacterized protein n=1 Tax=Neolewinella agarilytica TaxID=478744 RepID=A0A1H9LZ14_9BACT|nr:hypothetical protein [Neolewinella agarilytica]SER16642.1 hypothetical protein SAMN05444359_12645 [Neolewinella agarilytica]